MRLMSSEGSAAVYFLFVPATPGPVPAPRKGEIPVPLHHRTKRVSVRGPVSTVRGYCDPEVPPGRPQRLH